MAFFFDITTNSPIALAITLGESTFDEQPTLTEVSPGLAPDCAPAGAQWADRSEPALYVNFGTYEEPGWSTQTGPRGADGHVGVVRIVGQSSEEAGGIVTASGDADMRFDATGGLFVLSDLSVFEHNEHAWIPNPGGAADRWMSIWISNGQPDGGSTPPGCGYNMNEGIGPSGSWAGYLHIADVLIPAGATRSGECMIVDRRVFVWAGPGGS